MKLNNANIKQAAKALSGQDVTPKPCCNNPSPYAEFKKDIDPGGNIGIVVELSCTNCNTIKGWVHPYAYVDMLIENKDCVDILKRE